MSQIIDNFATEQQLEQINREIINQPLWRFGQRSHADSQYPMWFINLYNRHSQSFKSIATSSVQEIVEKLLGLFPDKKILRVMIAGNTYGQDGDVHTDHPDDDHVTCVIYLNKKWDSNWGGETIIFEDSPTTVIPKPGTAVIFSSKYPHVGKAPSRSCGQLRSVLAIQLCDK